MCGRYAFYLPPVKLQSFFGLENLINMPARYNCAPCQEMPIVIRNRMGFGRWGFRPEWSKQDDLGQASKMINARSESVADKPAFRDSWARGRRCIIPANGFFEWQKSEDKKSKQPYYIQHQSDEILCMAGLWSKVDDCVSYTVLTKPADGDIAQYHHRMPVMLARDDISDWFQADLNGAREMIALATGQFCRAHKVARDVGKVANDHEGLIAAITNSHIEEQDSQSMLAL
ncbi:MAG: SOS response-associated peptidase [Bdellovibrionales bacterium]